METKSTQPKTLQEAIVFYDDPKNCHDLLVSVRWPDGEIRCPSCNEKNVKLLGTRNIFKCYYCMKQFSTKVGTIFEDSPLSLSKWLPAVWMLCSAKNGMSSCELARSLDVTQKTAWFMLHRIREAMKTGTFQKLSGTVEADESYLGGLERNKHADKKVKAGGGTVGKSPVVGVLQRGDSTKPSQAIMRHTPKVTKRVLQDVLDTHVEPGSVLYTDAYHLYRKIVQRYEHAFVDHAYAYVSGSVHTNGLENFFCLLKRMFKGTYVSIEPFHLERYLDEQVRRFNTRDMKDGDRFAEVMSGIVGKRLTYAELTSEYEDYYRQVLP